LVPRRLVPSAYRPVRANRVFRRLILGFAVSYLGDGMSFESLQPGLLVGDHVCQAQSHR